MAHPWIHVGLLGIRGRPERAYPQIKGSAGKAPELVWAKYKPCFMVPQAVLLIWAGPGMAHMGYPWEPYSEPVWAGACSVMPWFHGSSGWIGPYDWLMGRPIWAHGMAHLKAHMAK